MTTYPIQDAYGPSPYRHLDLHALDLLTNDRSVDSFLGSIAMTCSQQAGFLLGFSAYGHLRRKVWSDLFDERNVLWHVFDHHDS